MYDGAPKPLAHARLAAEASQRVLSRLAVTPPEVHQKKKARPENQGRMAVILAPLSFRSHTIDRLTLPYLPYPQAAKRTAVSPPPHLGDGAGEKSTGSQPRKGSKGGRGSPAPEAKAKGKGKGKVKMGAAAAVAPTRGAIWKALSKGGPTAKQRKLFKLSKVCVMCVCVNFRAPPLFFASLLVQLLMTTAVSFVSFRFVRLVTCLSPI